MSFKTWLSVLTVALILVVLYFARDEIATAWNLLGRVNLWVLSLLIPLQILSYYGVGQMIFEYLKSKGDIQNLKWTEKARMALELNFVNHVLPSGGVSGFSYMGWRLKHLGVNTGRATMAQVVRYAMTFVAFLILLMLAVVIITIDGSVNRVIILFSSVLASSIIFMAVFTIYVVGSEARLRGFSKGLGEFINSFGKNVIMRKEPLLENDRIERFMMELHEDYLVLRKDKGLLKKPLIWGFVVTIADVSMFFVAFWALGVLVNPAPLLIAYGIAAISGLVLITPGGAGIYEVLMFSFLAAAGLPSGATIAAILLARVILVLGTLISGYIFYQLALLKYGNKPPADADIRETD